MDFKFVDTLSGEELHDLAKAVGRRLNRRAFDAAAEAFKANGSQVTIAYTVDLLAMTMNVLGRNTEEQVPEQQRELVLEAIEDVVQFVAEVLADHFEKHRQEFFDAFRKDKESDDGKEKRIGPRPFSN